MESTFVASLMAITAGIIITSIYDLSIKLTPGHPLTSGILLMGYKSVTNVQSWFSIKDHANIDSQLRHM